ncbi:MAG: magnesium transporter [Ruminococcus sp.]|nr:magnesium transporter [Ruminococcus sp.]
MAEANELERIKQAKDYFQRYYQFDDAVAVNQQNKEYLKTYIHNDYDVEDEFNFKGKFMKTLGVAAAIGLVMGLLLFLITGMWLVGAIVFGVLTAGLAILAAYVLKIRLNDTKDNQHEVNEGIKEQIAGLELRDQQLIRQRDDYYRGLKKRIDFMSLDYMDNIDQIEEILVNGEADTCEDAVAVFEQKLLLKEMTSFLGNEEQPEVQPLDPAKAKEMFGDPLEVIRENRKKRKKDKKADSIFADW